MTDRDFRDLDLKSVERQIDELIEKRAREAEAANREAQAESESLARYSLRGAAELRREWAEYYRHRIALYEDLARESREKLGRLIDGARSPGRDTPT